MKGVIIEQKKWICHIPQNVEKEESPWNGHKEKSLCAKSNRKPGPKKSKTDDFDEAKISDLSLCFSWRVFGLRLTHLTHSFPSQGDLSLEFSRTSLPRVWPRSLILPLIGWCHYRIDTHLNEVRKLNFFLEVENSGFVFTQVCPYLSKLIVYVVFSDFDETWPEYSSNINAQDGAML